MFCCKVVVLVILLGKPSFGIPVGSIEGSGNGLNEVTLDMDEGSGEGSGYSAVNLFEEIVKKEKLKLILEEEEEHTTFSPILSDDESFTTVATVEANEPVTVIFEVVYHEDIENKVHDVIYYSPKSKKNKAAAKAAKKAKKSKKRNKMEETTIDPWTSDERSVTEATPSNALENEFEIVDNKLEWQQVVVEEDNEKNDVTPKPKKNKAAPKAGKTRKESQKVHDVVVEEEMSSVTTL